MTRIAVPAVTTLLVVVLLIGANGYNRSGEPPQRITLTERELPLAWSGPDDQRGVRLRIEQQGRYDPFDARNWLTDERLRALGFVFDVMPGAPEAPYTYRRVLPKTAWVAFQYDGPAWRDIERQWRLKQPAGERNGWYPDSRLVPVDASRDRDALLARHPAGHLVLRASIQISYLDANNRGPLVYGTIRHLIPGEMSVPLELQDRLTGLAQRDEARTPRYEVDLAAGHLGIPFVIDVRRLQ